MTLSIFSSVIRKIMAVAISFLLLSIDCLRPCRSEYIDSTNMYVDEVAISASSDSPMTGMVLHTLYLVQVNTRGLSMDSTAK